MQKDNFSQPRRTPFAPIRRNIQSVTFKGKLEITELFQFLSLPPPYRLDLEKGRGGGGLKSRRILPRTVRKVPAINHAHFHKPN
ncbi:hypothetical protein CEXT_587431 [Caerostris extrusa]|uniref:Ribosomal protein S18 n=1 Tax=Caerostris extrusa TaxID=172846 RepID=A0AAV4Y8L6_CAEEX|nr:hypothetical protein CEXT_587431 [Caerostris extrusa]